MIDMGVKGANEIFRSNRLESRTVWEEFLLIDCATGKYL